MSVATASKERAGRPVGPGVQIDAGALPMLSAPDGLAQLSGYLNPYTQDVVNTTMAELNRQNHIALNNAHQNAAAENAFGGDPSIVGRVFQMNDRPHTVIGVLPSVPQFPQDNDVYMPTSACPFRSAPAFIGSMPDSAFIPISFRSTSVLLSQCQNLVQ